MTKDFTPKERRAYSQGFQKGRGVERCLLLVLMLAFGFLYALIMHLFYNPHPLI